MDSRIAAAIEAEIPPVALLFSDVKPEGAMQFTKGRWGCAMWLLASAAKGTPALADRETFGCLGGGTGLGFGNQYERWPGGIGCFYGFLSHGNDDTEEGREAAEQVRPLFRREAFEHFLHGEGYVKSPALVEKFVALLPITEVPTRYVVFKPLAAVGVDERPEVVIFLAGPDRLAALVVLANYARSSNESVTIPFAAGCQAIGILPYREGRSQTPRAVVGLIDLSARGYIAAQLRGGLFSFAVPFAMFEEMEGNVRGSFLERSTWRELLAHRQGDTQ
jgi:uncharacterized protein (DUF169 family)